MRVKAKGDGSEVWNVRPLRHMLMEKGKFVGEKIGMERIYRELGGREERKKERCRKFYYAEFGRKKEKGNMLFWKFL